MEELREKITKIDRKIVDLVAERNKLVKEVEKEKYENNEKKIIRLEIEERKMEQIKKWAKEKSLNPAFLQSLFYLIIAESCRTQISKRQER